MHRSVALSLALLTTIAAAPLSAQKSAPLRGWVKDKSGAPIVSAEVLVLGTKLSTRAGDDGAFRIDSVPSGPYWIGVRRLGFEPSMFSIRLAPSDERQFDVVLDPLPVGLATVEVRERSDFGRTRLREFDWRRRAGWGAFYTRDDLDKRQGLSLSQLVVRHFPFMSSYDLDWPDDRCDAFSRYSRCGSQFGFANNRGRYGHCAPAVSINGGPAMRGWGLGQFSTDDVEAVEVYRGDRMMMPLELSGPGTGCGVVVVWLK